MWSWLLSLEIGNVFIISDSRSWSLRWAWQGCRGRTRSFQASGAGRRRCICKKEREAGDLVKKNIGDHRLKKKTCWKLGKVGSENQAQLLTARTILRNMWRRQSCSRENQTTACAAQARALESHVLHSVFGTGNSWSWCSSSQENNCCASS